MIILYIYISDYKDREKKRYLCQFEHGTEPHGPALFLPFSFSASQGNLGRGSDIQTRLCE